MAQDIVNENQKISYTNLDFSAIYTETLDLIKKLTYRWDPSISDESDPGVVLVKLSALLADKMNYNIDKNILETFPLSVTQDGNARQLYDQLGYYMDWYQSGITSVTLNWIGQNTGDVVTYKIPKFTPICDVDQTSSKRYSLIGVEGANENIVSDILLTTDGKATLALAIEGFPVQYQYANEKIITSQMVDPLSHRLYFTTKYISQNGIFIKNTGQENYADWKRVNNLYENSFNELRYIFGYDSKSDTCFLEFPDNYAELFGSGIEITYLIIDPTAGNIGTNELTQFISPVTLAPNAGSDSGNMTLNSENVKITNFLPSSGHSNVEDIDEAYINYKKTVGTFKTLITLRDYLNYIRNKDLNICSNAFVCDRTNDIQTVYRIMSKKNDLDSIVVKVEKNLGDLVSESTFEYKFKLSSDVRVEPSKTYYMMSGNEMIEVENPIGNPHSRRYYELESKGMRSEDSLQPFSLKFYLLRKAISLNNKTAYNETFNIMNPYPDIDSLLSDTSHLEHVYEPIAPLGKNTYKKSEDEVWESNKSYWLYDTQEETYELISDPEQSFPDISPAESSNVYEIDIEALMPHTVLFKAVYPVIMNISTYSVLDADTQSNILSNIISELYKQTASSEMEFGQEVSVEYLSNIARNSDDRIKAVSVEPITYYLYATYFDEESQSYIEVRVDNDMGKFEPDSYRSLPDIVGALIKKDIMAKSILAGTSQLIVPDSEFMYHLPQEFIAYYEGISNVTSEAIIDISSASTTYSLASAESKIRKTYTLKDNETLSLYRPKLETSKQFLSGIHYEYVLRNTLEADSSYKLSANEYFILYEPIRSDENNSIIGYTAYACGNGCIIDTSFMIPAQPDISSLSNFAKSKIISYYELNSSESYYEESTYNNTYMIEIRNSASIVNNVIGGNDHIGIQNVDSVTLTVGDKYKFFWILNEPTYSSNENLKTYTLFNRFDSEADNKLSDTINSYTLKNNEILFYTDAEGKNLVPLGAGTTIIRNCGVDSAEYSDVKNSLYFAYINEISQIIDSANISFLTDSSERIRPRENGLYEVESGEPHEVSQEDNPFELNLYEFNDDTSVEFYIPTTDTEPDESKTYYDVTFIRSLDPVADNSKAYYLLVMRKEEGWYYKKSVTDENGNVRDVYNSDDLYSGCFEKVEIKNYDNPQLINPVEEGYYKKLSYNGQMYIDTYSLADGLYPTEQNRFALAADILASVSDFTNRGSEYFEHDSSIVDRRILKDTNSASIDISNLNTYADIDLASDIFNPAALNLLEPTKYRDYFIDDQGTPKEDVNYLTNPYIERLYVYDEEDEQYHSCREDKYIQFTPEILEVKKTASNAIFSEYDSLYHTDIVDKGFYFKPNSISTIYRYRGAANSTSYLSTALAYDSSTSPLKALYNKFISSSATMEFPDPDTTNCLEAISDSWSSSITFQKPYYIEPAQFTSDTSYTYDDLVSYNSKYYRCLVPTFIGAWDENSWGEVELNWRTASFTDTGMHLEDTLTDLSNKWVKVDSNTIINQQIQVGTIYPAFEFDGASTSNSLFYVQASYYVALGLPTDTTEVYTKNDIDVQLDKDIKLYQLFPNKSFDINNYCTMQLYCLPKLYRFNDFVRFTDTEYYVPKDLANRHCDVIDAWTCTALNLDAVNDDPINTINNLWASIQTNTSITIIANEVYTFSSGDKLVFEGDENTEVAINWPTFSNNETILDLDAYSILYQKKEEEVKELPKLDVDSYKWRGYSSLLLNTSGTNGQKLESNHSVSLYEDELSVEPVAIIQGDSNKSISLQLKYPVSNSSGAYISVSTTNALNEEISNSVYVYKPYDNGDYYKYDTFSNATSLYFNSIESGTEYSPQNITIPFGLPGGEYLIGVKCKDNAELTAICNNILYIDDVGYNLDAPVINTDSGYELDSTYVNVLHSYMNEDRTKFIGNKYDYIYLNTGSGGFRKITAPSLLAVENYPYELGWYKMINGEHILVSEDDDEFYAKGTDLLQQVFDPEEGENPSENGWYVLDGGVFKLSGDTEVVEGVDYYKEPELYVVMTEIKSSLTFSVNRSDMVLTYVLDDIFKFMPNPDLGDFELVREKVRALDVDDEYNYTFVPANNDLIPNPLEPKSFFNPNHIFGKFIIPQLDFENLGTRFTTIR